VTVVIDSTGLKVFGRGEWHLEKYGSHARRTWRMLHLAVDPDSGVILASALTSNEEGDASLVGPLLDQIARQIGTVLADGAYDGEPVYRAVAAHSPAAEVIIPPRSTAVPSATTGNASSQRDRHIQRIGLHNSPHLAPSRWNCQSSASPPPISYAALRLLWSHHSHLRVELRNSCVPGGPRPPTAGFRGAATSIYGIMRLMLLSMVIDDA